MRINKALGGILLIAGTCIGAGMLALPITMGASGLLFSTLLLSITWLMMFLTGLYVLEANVVLPAGANFISMAKATLGKAGDVVAWVTYLLLLYSLMAAYLSGGGDIVINAVQSLSKVTLQDWIAPLPWVVGGALVIYLGVKFVDEFNRILIFGLVISYFLLIFIMTPHVNLNLFNVGNPKYLFPALPVVMTSFGYHVIIPSLRNYLEGDIAKLVKIIFWGSITPLFVYIIWEFVVFGTVPVTGTDGLSAIFQAAHPALRLTQSLENLLHNTFIVEIANFFIFFAIATSFLGISLSLFDFLSDGFQIPKTYRGKIIIAVITFLPPLIYALLFPKGFILALSYAGVFVAILHGILPALMVWAARSNNMSNIYRAPLGRFGIFIILIFSSLIILSQIALNFNWVHVYPFN